MTMPADRPFATSLACTLSLAAAIALGMPSARGAGDAHPHGPGTAKLVLNQGQKWATDEPLRAGMQAIRAALAADLPAIHRNQLRPARYDALAQKVNAEVAAIVQNCKLDKEADAQLHLLIAEILAGAEAMQARTPAAARRGGAERIAAALNQYGRFFAHPGWRNL